MMLLLILALSVHVFTADKAQTSSVKAVTTISEALTKKHIALADDAPLTIEIMRPDVDHEDLGSTTRIVGRGVATTTKDTANIFQTTIKVVLKDKDEQWFTGESRFSPSKAAEDAAKKFLKWADDNGLK